MATVFVYFACFSHCFRLTQYCTAANQLPLSHRVKHNNRSRTPLCECACSPPHSQNVQYWETAHMQRLRPLIGCGRSLAQARANEGPPLFVFGLVRCYKTAAAMRDEKQRHSKHTKDARTYHYYQHQQPPTVSWSQKGSTAGREAAPRRL